MDENTTKIFTSELGKAVAQTLILNIVATIGVFGGMIAVGAAIGKVQDLRNKKSKTATAE